MVTESTSKVCYVTCSECTYIVYNTKSLNHVCYLPMWLPCNLTTRCILLFIPSNKSCNWVSEIEFLIATSLACSSSVLPMPSLSPNCCSIHAQRFSIGDRSGELEGQFRKCPPGTFWLMHSMLVLVLCAGALSLLQSATS